MAIQFGQIPTSWWFMFSGGGNPTSISIESGSQVNIDFANIRFKKWTTDKSQTIHADTIPQLGEKVQLLILGSGILPKIISFGDNFRANLPDLTGLLSNYVAIEFVSDGFELFECNRYIGV